METKELFEDSTKTLPTEQADSPQVKQLVGKPSEPDLRLRFEFSPQGIGKLFGALAKARKTFKPVLKTSKNPFFKSNYADLAEVVEATKDGLSDNGLAVVQPPCFRKSDGTVEIHTFLGHESGEWIRSSLDMPAVKHDPQGVGSAITYGRRYAYSGMLSVASESDDDGNLASGKSDKAVETAEEFALRTDSQTCIAPFQQKAIQDAMAHSGKTETDLLTYLGLVGHKRLEHVLKTEFNELLKWANGKAPKPNGKDAAVKHPNTVNSFDHAWPKLYALAKEKHIPEADVKRYYTDSYKVESGAELTPLQFSDVMAWVQQS